MQNMLRGLRRSQRLWFKVKMIHSILFFSQIEHIQKIGALEIDIFPTPIYCAPNVVGFL